MRILSRSWPAVIGTLLFLVCLSAGCGNQKEGERCDIRNFNADCDDGLACVQIAAGAGQQYQVCCYLGAVANPAPACIQGPVSTGGSGDAAAPDVAVDAIDENADGTGPGDASADVGATE
jgi:hypothetical protein